MRHEGESPLTLGREIARKLLHVASGVIPVLYAAGVDRRLLASLLAGASIVALIIEVARFRLASIGEVFDRTAGRLLRPHERHHWSGATWLLFSFLLVVVLFPRPIAVAAMWAVAVGDASAAIIGRVVGSRRGRPHRKTLAGSIACALMTILGALVIARLPLGPSIVGGVVAAAAEWPTGPIDDNVRIGLAVGVGILLSHMVFS